MSSSSVLLVAADDDDRRALVLALEATGFQIQTRDEPPPRSWLVKHRHDCTLLDQKVLSGPDYEQIAFCIKAHPVVLMAAVPSPWLIEWVTGIVNPVVGTTEIAKAIGTTLQIAP